MVNVNNIDRVIEAIREEKVAHFNMGEWYCGTAACIGGFCNILEVKDKNISLLSLDAKNAKSFLGISYSQCSSLVFMGLPPQNYHDVTKEIAILVLEHLRDHSVVDWDRAFREAKG